MYHLVKYRLKILSTVPSGSTVAAANDGVLKDLLTYVAMFLVNSILKQSGIVPSDDATYQVRRMI